ncbi:MULTISPECIES: lipopolysaccharide biosynthesis protein [Tenebrionibacter/Tenebrionicola group]|jgi:O-antigen/teichoic acid export membrane protein|uniref:Putative O-antigen transporter n=2 Tax=Tenebrionibacter/Tenebrionicola group TaxID=2969848 RepID=A0A8K0V1J0_9ENTR|nr:MULTISPECIES: oligosaccharide flippase family protein [Tenebrionibacter/Tenebrionicola group]MBK4715238.1 oligosaccharide flippase family protein [Tenebrionibacter intestinalis]MBV5094169.1 oligosaccharide flippase family protein [Tenebrionicola larvae]
MFNINRTNKLFFVLGTGLSGIISILTLPILTWFYAVDIIGIYSIFTVTFILFSTLFSLALEQAVIREYYETENKTALISGAFCSGILAAIILSLSFAVFYQYISEFVFETHNGYGFILIILSALVYHWYRYQSLLLRMEGESFYFFILQISQKIFFLVITWVVFIFKKKLGWIDIVSIFIFSSILSSLISVVCMRKLKVTLYAGIKKSYKKKFKVYINYSLPLLFSCVIVWGMGAVDKYALKIYSNAYELGIYANAFRVASALVLLQQLISTIWIPTAMKWYTDGEPINKYERVASLVLFISAVSFFIICAASPLLHHLIHPDYWPSIKLIPIILLYPVFYILSEITGVGLYFNRKTKHTVFISFCTFIFCMLINAVLVKKFQSLGASVAIATSYFIFFFLRTIFSSIAWKYLLSIKDLFTLFLLVAGGIGIYREVISFTLIICIIITLFVLYYSLLKAVIKEGIK